MIATATTRYVWDKYLYNRYHAPVKSETHCYPCPMNTFYHSFHTTPWLHDEQHCRGCSKGAFNYGY